jgi:hypothetical protein
LPDKTCAVRRPTGAMFTRTSSRNAACIIEDLPDVVCPALC